jgi:hypothetical protein
MRQRTIGPASSGLGQGWAGRDIFIQSCSSYYSGGPGACMLTRSPVGRCFLRHIDAAGLSEHCVKKQCGLAGSCFRGRMGLDLHLSRVSTGVAAMGQDCNYQLDVTKLWRKRGKMFFFKGK